jgi:hypothetical protein
LSAQKLATAPPEETDQTYGSDAVVAGPVREVNFAGHSKAKKPTLVAQGGFE